MAWTTGTLLTVMAGQETFFVRLDRGDREVVQRSFMRSISSNLDVGSHLDWRSFGTRSAPYGW